MFVYEKIFKRLNHYVFYYFIHVHTDVIDDSSILTHRYSQHKLSELCSIAKKTATTHFPLCLLPEYLDVVKNHVKSKTKPLLISTD